MSFKFAAQKVGACHYVLPRTNEMRCDAHAFFREDLYQASEEEMWKQLAHGASLAGVDAAYAMPDAHAGFGVPIGSVLVTQNVLHQAAAGYDIGCGMILAQVKGARAQAARGKYERRRWITEVEKRVATGVGVHRAKESHTYDDKTVDAVLREGAAVIGADVSKSERHHFPVSDRFNGRKIDKAYKNAAAQLCTLGGGNHFIELQCDPEDGSLWVMVHTGSRGYGYQTAEHFFHAGSIARGISSTRREESFLYIDEPLGIEYWDHHNSAANYAAANRHAIIQAIAEATAEVFNADLQIFYEISHNLVQLEPIGPGRIGFVHRKGATRAFPVVDEISFENAGHPIVTPGSMYEGAAVMRPLPGALMSGFSVNHGSGRVMGRKEAKRKLTHKQGRIDEEMNTVARKFAGVSIEGIMMNSRHVPLDECGEVYKKLDPVLSTLETEGIAKIERRLYPIACVKGSD